MKKFLLVFAAVITISISNLQAQWSTDYKAGLEQAAKSKNKRVLLNFTGSDWCGWCIQLKKEVFSQKGFQDFAKTNLVLVELDFPSKKPQSVAEANRNKVLAAQYRIEGYPTIVVLNAQGKEIGRLGYVEGGPKAFLAELGKFK